MGTKDFIYAVMELLLMQQNYSIKVSKVLSNYTSMSDIVKGIDRRSVEEYKKSSISFVSILIDVHKQIGVLLDMYLKELTTNPNTEEDGNNDTRTKDAGKG